MSNIIDKKIFKQIFVHAFETLENKLINTRNKEESQIILNNISKNKKKSEIVKIHIYEVPSFL